MQEGLQLGAQTKPVMENEASYFTMLHHQVVWSLSAVQEEDREEENSELATSCNSKQQMTHGNWIVFFAAFIPVLTAATRFPE